ncbi:MAG TPA: translation elongation factor 4 [Candidatus Saccharimonadales bacterium]|nr:translation elongation factor 4 [Candidatus Saccharimonadales bacterium]
MKSSDIRNFCIIAHIDHGKSTLADRLLELTGTVEKRQMKAQLLDQMDLERERGITIKLAPVRMYHEDFELNLIDTPGHVDFSYEVSRSLEACEGALLVVDATQGIQAQTLANVYLALGANLKIIPIINKIDLPAADIKRTTGEVCSLLGCKPEDILPVSAKTGEGVDLVLERIIKDVPPPSGSPDKPLRALIFDTRYDDYRGVIVYVRVVDGQLLKGSNIRVTSTNIPGIALEIGSLSPQPVAGNGLLTGEIGYVVTNLKSTREAKVGDTITLVSDEIVEPLPGYRDVRPFVYAGFFPSSNEFYGALKDAIDKLSLSDSSMQFSPENSPVLGYGFRIGFLGLLHLDIVKERLEREYSLELIITNPSTDYQVTLLSGEEIIIKSAADLPDQTTIKEIREPWVKGEIVCPKDYIGPVLQLVVQRRGLQKDIHYVDSQLAVINFEAPLSNLLTDFYDALKSLTSGYGSFNYELDDYRTEDLVRLDFYVAGEKVDALSVVAHRSESLSLGRSIVDKLKEVIPRQQFQVSLQAAIGGKFIAREDVSAFRKDVTTGLYGGDVTRKKKVLAKQKKGKERMKRFGKVDIPADAFTVMLRRD